ncbi:TonB-dependent receptor [Thauera sinica]|uniref:TonB-dependent siderophore receptor n=1 Tax=Thauera sinica TaxID=2665146 RepID=A0ABW1AQC1_9RHOO|nr:TonB-dependent receptor [Thauera sp. K11]
MQLALVALVAGGVVPQAAAQAQPGGARTAVAADVPAGPLAEALNRFAVQAGISLAVDAGKLKGKSSRGITGSVTAEEGLQRLLAGSGFRLGRNPAGYVLVPESAQEPSSDGTATLPAVRVHATAGAWPDELPGVYAGGQVAKGARLGALGNTDVMDTPFSITSYTSEVIRNQQASTVGEVLVNDPSVRFTTSNGHMYENFRVRGFDINASELAVNGTFGLVPVGHVPIEFVERVEILKGPSALFSGMVPGGGVGGVINLVPKRAGDEPLARLSLGYRSEGQWGGSIDAGRRLGENKAVGVRVNASYTDGDTDLDGQSKRREFLSVGADYRSDALKASVDAYQSKESYTGGTPAMYQFRAALTDIPKAPDPDINLFRGLYGTLESSGAVFRVEYEFSPQISAFASAGVMNHDYSGFINGTHARQIAANGNYSAWASGQLGYNDNVSAEAGLRVRFERGEVAHQVVVHASRLDMEAGSGVLIGPTYTSNIYHPSVPIVGRLPARAGKTSETTLASLALVDTLSFMDDAVQLTLGARKQGVETTNFNSNTGAVTAKYDKDALTPAVAVLVKPWGPALSLYASYVQGLSQGGTVTDATATNYRHVFAPYKTEQKEIGAKWDAGSFANTLAAFELTKPTLVKIGDTYTDEGEQRIRGVEWTTFGALSRDVRLLGGIAHTRGTQTKTANNLYNGKDATAVPRWQANLGLEWDTPWLPGLTLSGRVIGTSSQYINAANTQRIPGWSQVDVGVRYGTKVGGHDVALRLNVANLFDRHYWSGSFSENFATLGPARSVTASATVDF